MRSGCLAGRGADRTGGGDEDGDGFTDLEEACVLGTDPCVDEADLLDDDD